MKNIFEGAKFGDKFLTRDGRIAIYWRKETNEKWHELIVSNDNIGLYVEEDGLAVGNHIITPEWDDDIVSKYTKPVDEDKIDEDKIDEDKIDELAYEQSPYGWTEDMLQWEKDEGIMKDDAYREGFKSGYLKAKGLL